MIIALCIAVFAAQIASGRRHVWLPGFVTKRGVKEGPLIEGKDKLEKVADVMDGIVRQLLRWLASGAVRRMVAGLIVVLCFALPVLELGPSPPPCPSVP